MFSSTVTPTVVHINNGSMDLVNVIRTVCLVFMRVELYINYVEPENAIKTMKLFGGEG